MFVKSQVNSTFFSHVYTKKGILHTGLGRIAVFTCVKVKNMFSTHVLRYLSTVTLLSLTLFTGGKKSVVP